MNDEFRLPQPGPAAVAEPPAAPPPPLKRRRWWSPETRRTPDRPCLNCGDTTVGFFCANCGQRKVDVRVSLRRMLMEALDDQLSVNSALPRTAGALLVRPGLLTCEYMKGRIVRYIPPLRLYLVTSLLFFVVLGLVANINEMVDGARGPREGAADSIATPAAPTVAKGRGPVAPPAAPEVPAVGVSKREGGRLNINIAPTDSVGVPRWLLPVHRHLRHTEDRLNAMPTDEALRTIIQGGLDNAPTGVFLMMPVFALILKLLYFRRKRFYVEHFVFALHVHAFTFVVFGLLILLPEEGVVGGLLFLWLMIYVFLAMKRVYEQSFLRTFVKYVMLGWAYMFVLTFGVMATLVVTALTV